jgi:nicotinamide-nucleotide amidase
MSDLGVIANDFLQASLRRKILVATAESCTGGLIAATLTEIPGSSSMVECGFVTYSNEAKTKMLGVSPATLKAHGAVSEETALEMAAGALANSRAGIALSVTGIAGPDGGSADKPVGLVWFGLCLRGGKPEARKHIFDNRGRAVIRQETVRTALSWGIEALSEE